MYGIDFGAKVNNPSQNINNGNSSFKEHQMHNIKLTEIDSISDNISESEMRDRVDLIIKKWTLGVSDQPKNLLMILSTLKEVWSKDPKLHDISLKELVDDPSLASKTYRRCMLLFHDDKIKNYNMKDKYVAKQIYYILTQAQGDHRK